MSVQPLIPHLSSLIPHASFLMPQQSRIIATVKSPRRMTVLPDLLVLLLAGGLAVGVTWPTVLHFGSQVPGDLLSDRDQNLWNLWWVKWALIDHPTNPYH